MCRTVKVASTYQRHKPTDLAEPHNHWDYEFCPSSGILNNWKTFRKLDLFPSSHEGREKPVLLGPLDRTNLNHLKTETDPVSETSCFLVT
jgi:hypothetical protein